jgi:putative DNA methylase
MGVQLLAMAAQSSGGRVYLAPTAEHESGAALAEPADAPDLALPAQALGFRVQSYGFTRYVDLFTARQMHALAAFADAVAEVPDWVRTDGGDESYAKAISSVLGLCVGKLAQSNSSQVRWYIDSRNGAGQPLPAFGRHALSMVWDFAETNPFGGSVGDWLGQVDSSSRGIRALPIDTTPSTVLQLDARDAERLVESPALVATDPPYFAQIGYADLSDYFYIWLRRALRHVHPDFFATIGAPKDAELIASPHRHDGDVARASRAFVEGFTKTFSSLSEVAHPAFPMLVVYAHRQEEATAEGLTSTAWDSMLEAILAAGLSIVGTWPIHGTHSSRQRGHASNALASYIVMVCRPRPVDAVVTDRRGFLAALRGELPDALRDLQRVSVAPVDLAQAAIGPGMAVYSKYAQVIEASGEAMSVRTALGLINQVLSEVLEEQEDEFDPETRWAIKWFEQHGMDEGAFGDADLLARAKNTSVHGMVEAGIVHGRGGKVRLLQRHELDEGWDPGTDPRRTVWEGTQHLIKQLQEGGDEGAAELISGFRDGEVARDLAYRLYATCERKGWSQEAIAYNSLVVAWPEILRLAGEPRAGAQTELEV